MKRWLIYSFALIVVCGLAGCGDTGRESAFLTGFSIGSIIEANEQYLIAPHTVSGGVVSEPPVPFFQMHEEAIVQIDPSHIPAFMEVVRSSVERSLTGSGAQIVGRGAAIDSTGQSPSKSPTLVEQGRPITFRLAV